MEQVQFFTCFEGYAPSKEDGTKAAECTHLVRLDVPILKFTLWNVIYQHGNPGRIWYIGNAWQVAPVYDGAWGPCIEVTSLGAVEPKFLSSDNVWASTCGTYLRGGITDIIHDSGGHERFDSTRYWWFESPAGTDDDPIYYDTSNNLGCLWYPTYTNLVNGPTPINVGVTPISAFHSKYNKQVAQWQDLEMIQSSNHWAGLNNMCNVPENSYPLRTFARPEQFTQNYTPFYSTLYTGSHQDDAWINNILAIRSQSESLGNLPSWGWDFGNVDTRTAIQILGDARPYNLNGPNGWGLYPSDTRSWRSTFIHVWGIQGFPILGLGTLAQNMDMLEVMQSTSTKWTCLYDDDYPNFPVSQGQWRSADNLSGTGGHYIGALSQILEWSSDTSGFTSNGIQCLAVNGQSQYPQHCCLWLVPSAWYPWATLTIKYRHQVRYKMNITPGSTPSYLNSILIQAW